MADVGVPLIRKMKEFRLPHACADPAWPDRRVTWRLNGMRIQPQADSVGSTR